MILLSLVLASAMNPIQKVVLVDTELRNGDLYCTVEAVDFPVHQLMATLCRKSGLSLVGFEDIEESQRVTVYLKGRPLNVAVDYVLGAAGLVGQVSAKAVTVSTAIKPFADREHSLQAAEIAYLSALQRFPGGPEAAAARLSLADIALMRNEKQKAVRHYELLADQETDANTHLQARRRAGSLLIELEEWARAIPHLRFVAEADTDRETVVEARRNLARCVLMRGEHQQALHMIRALDHIIEPLNTFDEADRLMIKARAKIGIGSYHDALRDLDRAQQMSGGAIDEFEGMDLRALAMELDGRPVDAALGWVHFSRDKSDDKKRAALIRAAEIALSVDGEELAVIFLHKHAANEGLGDALIPHVNEARARLGLESVTYSDATLSIRLNRAIQELNAGNAKQCSDALKLLRPTFMQLGATDRVRFGTTYASLLESSDGVLKAIDLLREVVRTLESIENRSRIYMLAGEIYERHKRFDEAAAAYGGEL